MWIAGVDLAWGERNPDGVALLRISGRRARLVDCRRVQGDAALIGWVQERIPAEDPALILADGPIVCPNLTGSRPVDRETHRIFGRHHAGCHPASRSRCPRPPRIARQLGDLGFVVGHDLAQAPRLLAEVYPHPAMIRFFGLDRILKYKRGPVMHRRREFRRLQRLIRGCLPTSFPELRVDAPLEALLTARWSKEAEDRLDAFLCALIGLHHWRHRGRRTQVLGDLVTGFLLVPQTSDGESPTPIVRGSDAVGRLAENRHAWIVGRRCRLTFDDPHKNAPPAASP